MLLLSLDSVSVMSDGLELHPPVPGPVFIGVIGHNRLAEAETVYLQPLRGDPFANDVPSHRVCSFIG